MLVAVSRSEDAKELWGEVFRRTWTQQVEQNPPTISVIAQLLEMAGHFLRGCSQLEREGGGG